MWREGRVDRKMPPHVSQTPYEALYMPTKNATVLSPPISTSEMPQSLQAKCLTHLTVFLQLLDEQLVLLRERLTELRQRFGVCFAELLSCIGVSKRLHNRATQEHMTK